MAVSGTVLVQLLAADPYDSEDAASARTSLAQSRTSLGPAIHSLPLNSGQFAPVASHQSGLRWIHQQGRVWKARQESSGGGFPCSHLSLSKEVLRTKRPCGQRVPTRPSMIITPLARLSVGVHCSGGPPRQSRPLLESQDPSPLSKSRCQLVQWKQQFPVCHWVLPSR